MIRKVRIVWQLFFVVLFFALLYLATQLRMDGWPVALMAWADPLIGIVTTAASAQMDQWVRLLCVGCFILGSAMALWPGRPNRLRNWLAGLIVLAAGAGFLAGSQIDFYRPLALGLVVIVASVFLGRAFCGWVCPFGAIQHFVGWLGNIPRSRKERIAVGGYRRLFVLKYYVLAAVLVAAALGVQQAGLLDPIALLTRSVTATVLPAVDAAGIHIGGDGYRHWAWFTQEHHVVGGWLIAAAFVTLLLANLWVPRFFCKAVCPLGALLGVLSGSSLFRHRRCEGECTDCGLCDAVCPTAAEPDRQLRIAECIVCFNCSDACPTGAMRFDAAAADSRERVGPDMSRRGLLAAAAVGFSAWPFGRMIAPCRTRPDSRAVRPPGSLAEQQFLAACIKCNQCARACPTGVIQPAIDQTGWEGLWTPVMDYKLGYCEYNCTACGAACPTGAIRALSLDEKQGRGEFAKAGPVRLGTAFVNRGRCLPWSTLTPCIVCQEVCPVSPKAIYIERVRLVNRQGKTVWLQRPWVDPKRCIGCGICSHKCPVTDSPAIYVTGINATRDKARRLIL